MLLSEMRVLRTTYCGETLLLKKMPSMRHETSTKKINMREEIKRTIKDERKPPLLGERIRGFIDLARPLTVVTAFFATLFLGVAACKFFGAPFSWEKIIVAGLSLGLMHGGAQAWNLSLKEEVEIDLFNKKTYRPIPRGIITHKEGKLFAVATMYLSFLIGTALDPYFGAWLLLIAFFSIAYSTQPFRIKKFFFGNNLWQGIARGGLPIFAVFSIFGSPFTHLTLSYSIVVTTWVTGAQATKDVKDVLGDKRYHIKTFFTELSHESALRLMSGLMGVSFLMLLSFVITGYLPNSFLFITFLAVPSLYIIRCLEAESRLFENNFSWVIFYCTLGAFYLLPAILL